MLFVADETPPPPTLVEIKNMSLQNFTRDVKLVCNKLLSAPFRVNTNISICDRYIKEGKQLRPVLECPWMKYSSISNESITLVTQMTMSKVEVFERLIHMWTGPISVAIYLDCNSSLTTLFTHIDKWMHRENLDVHIVPETGVSDEIQYNSFVK